MSLKEQLVGQQIADSEAARRMVTTFATLEQEHLRAAIDLAEAAGIETEHIDPPTVEDRAAALLEVTQTVLGGEFEAWHAEQVGRRWDSEPPAEWVGAGTDSDVWQEQVATWADAVREAHPDVDATDRELAAVAARDVYGVDLEALEREVVGIEPSSEVNRLVTGNFAASRTLMGRVTERLEQGTLEVPEGGE